MSSKKQKQMAVRELSEVGAVEQCCDLREHLKILQSRHQPWAKLCFKASCSASSSLMWSLALVSSSSLLSNVACSSCFAAATESDLSVSSSSINFLASFSWLWYLLVNSLCCDYQQQKTLIGYHVIWCKMFNMHSITDDSQLTLLHG